MKTKNNKTCIVCGTKYTYCPTCAEFANVAIWHNIYHDENCKEIFAIAVDFNSGILDKNIAKERLDKCDLSNKKSFNKSILKAINEIDATETYIKTKEVDNVESVEEVAIEENVVEEIEVKENNFKAKKYKNKI